MTKSLGSAAIGDIIQNGLTNSNVFAIMSYDFEEGLITTCH